MSRQYLVDTHILLWVLNADSRLSDHHRDIFLAGEDVVVSAVSVAEIATQEIARQSHAHRQHRGNLAIERRSDPQCE
ncbi:PIN domain-containing protein [Mesorhizobium sp.]|uniref:PIN domain-containing protein n=1 Tax=Mesorhizobium sp. TaxID=1871066 RepID=UPI0025E1A68A|nr:PIN domain-containing protein [Mesorhizobium sp.]